MTMTLDQKAVEALIKNHTDRAMVYALLSIAQALQGIWGHLDAGRAIVTTTREGR